MKRVKTTQIISSTAVKHLHQYMTCEKLSKLSRVIGMNCVRHVGTDHQRLGNAFFKCSSVTVAGTQATHHILL